MRTLKDLFIAVVLAQYKCKMEMVWYSFLIELFTTVLVFRLPRNVNFQLKLVMNVGKRRVVCQKANNIINSLTFWALDLSVKHGPDDSYISGRE